MKGLMEGRMAGLNWHEHGGLVEIYMSIDGKLPG